MLKIKGENNNNGKASTPIQHLIAGLEGAEESMLLRKCLESSVTELRRSIDELELHFLEITARSVNHEGLAKGNDTLLGTGNRAL